MHIGQIMWSLEDYKVEPGVMRHRQSRSCNQYGANSHWKQRLSAFDRLTYTSEEGWLLSRCYFVLVEVKMIEMQLSRDISFLIIDPNLLTLNMWTSTMTWSSLITITLCIGFAPIQIGPLWDSNWFIWCHTLIQALTFKITFMLKFVFILQTCSGRTLLNRHI